MSTLKKMILHAHKHDQFFDATVWGQEKGIGKTSFAWITSADIYNSFATSYKYLFFSPLQALTVFEETLENDIKLPVIVMDDAGLYLGKRSWYESERVAFTEFYNVIREVCSCVLFTSPRMSDILKGIRDQINYQVKIYSVKNSDILREARIYEKYQTPILREIIQKTAVDQFRLDQMDTEWYSTYRKQKKKFVSQKIKQARQMFQDLQDKETGKKKVRLKDVVGKVKFQELCMSYGVTQAMARTIYDEMREMVEGKYEEPPAQ